MHILMAETILRGWGFSDEAASVILDARSGAVNKAIGSTVKDVRISGSELVWSELDNPDELRFTSQDGSEMLYHDLLGSRHTGTRILSVTGLNEGKYILSIDGKELVGTFTASELAAGIHLELLDTPMHRAGVALYYACSNAEAYQTDRTRMLGDLAKLQNAEIVAAGHRFLEDAVGRSLSKISQSAIPTKHTYRVTITP
jgi:hypothetical protein